MLAPSTSLTRLHRAWTQEFDARVERLRLQRIAGEFRLRQRSAALRQATLVEVALREAFLDALEAEREALVARRRAEGEAAAARLPNFRRVLRRAEHQYLEQQR